MLIDFLSTFISINFSNFHKYDIYYINLFSFEIFFFLILSKYLLKLEIYKHHIFSLFIIVIGLIIIHLLHFQINFRLNDIFIIFILLIYHYIFTFQDILAYYLLNQYNFDIYTFSFIIGLLGILISFIISIFNLITDFNCLNLNINTYIILFKEQPFKKILTFLFVSLFNGITYTYFWSIFKYFKPWFYGVFSPIYGLLNTIYMIFTSNEEMNVNIIEIIIYIILIFACLIFNEQIICNFWELSKNTKKEIMNRAKNETQNLQQEISMTNTDFSLFEIFA